MADLYHNISDRAYFNYTRNPYLDPIANWDEARREELLEQKIQEEAFLLHQRTHGDAVSDYLKAKQYVDERLKLLAYYVHERDYNRKPQDCWREAQEIYINNF
jgi:hypothetical protein